MIRTLPTFQGYTVDARLKEFRRLNREGIERIEFDSIEGDALLTAYIETLNVESLEFNEIANAIC